MPPNPSTIEEAIRFAASDYERLQREADDSVAAKEREATAYRRLVWWLAHSLPEAKP